MMSHSQVSTRLIQNTKLSVPVRVYETFTQPKRLVHGIIDVAFQNRQHLELLHDGRLERSQDLLEVVLGAGADILRGFRDQGSAGLVHHV